MILQILTLIAIIIVGLIQAKQMKAQEGINKSIKTFFDIFKIDEVKKYVDLKEANIRMESEQKEKQIRSNMNDTLVNISNRSSDQMQQLLGLGFSLIVRVPPNTRRQFVENNLKEPLKATFLEYLTQVENIYLPDPPESIGLLNVLLSQKINSTK